MRLHLLGPGDRALLDRVAPDVFDGPLDPDLTAEFLADPRHHLVVAVDDGTVIGFASGVHYLHPDKRPELFINELGVAPTHRRQGIATALLDELRRHAARLGCATAWVLTEDDNAPARDCYRKAGATEAPRPVMFTLDCRE